MTSLQEIPFSKLIASDAINARPATKEGLDALAASIAAKGIIQPLCVRPADSSEKFEVIDGRRRFAALAKLVKDKVIAKSYPVPVIIRNEDDATALESSLIANTQRLPMHAVDQYTVFARLSGEGASDAEIAARFGIPERQVRQQKALGRLAPAIREAWKKGKIEPEVAKAFAEHPDVAVQEAAYEKLKARGSYGLSEHAVRSELSDTRIAVAESDEFAIVGEEAYLAAGGTLTESLFAEDRFVDDVPLVKKLARDRLQAECDRLKAEGWAWAKVSLDDEDPREWDFDGLRGGTGGEESGDGFTAEERARSGCLVSLSDEWDRKTGASTTVIAISYGLIAQGGAANQDDDAGEDDEDSDGADLGSEIEDEAGGDADDEAAGEPDPYKISSALINTITEAMTHAAADALTADPKLAQTIIAAALLSRFTSPANVHNQGMPALRRERFDSFAAGLTALLKMDRDAVDVLFADAIASTLDLRESTWQFKSRDSGIDALVAALPGVWYLQAMRRRFNAADYFKRATKATALAAIGEIVEAGQGGNLAPIDVLADMKKADLATAAAEAAAACGWLPPQLRHPDYSLIGEAGEQGDPRERNVGLPSVADPSAPRRSGDEPRETKSSEAA